MQCEVRFFRKLIHMWSPDGVTLNGRSDFCANTIVSGPLDAMESFVLRPSVPSDWMKVTIIWVDYGSGDTRPYSGSHLHLDFALMVRRLDGLFIE
jgi:hypothetical protein